MHIHTTRFKFALGFTEGVLCGFTAWLELPELSELLELLQRELYDILQIFYRSIAIVWCALVKAREKLSVLY